MAFKAKKDFIGLKLESVRVGWSGDICVHPSRKTPAFISSVQFFSAAPRLPRRRPVPLPLTVDRAFPKVPIEVETFLEK
jgi:hypothetical protein